MTLDDQMRCGVTLDDQLRCGVTLDDQLRCGVTLDDQLRRGVTLDDQLRCGVTLDDQLRRGVTPIVHTLHPCSHLGVDFITDLPPSDGSTFILVIVDRFSKACHIVNLKRLKHASQRCTFIDSLQWKRPS